MRALGFRDVEIDPAGNALGYLGSGGSPRVLIDGHIDSIPLHSPRRWTVDPFGGEIRDGRLFGLGVCDQKASIAAAAYGLAAQDRDSAFRGTVALVASVCGQQVEGAALAPAVKRFAPDVAITTEPSDTRLSIGQRGRARLWARITGRSSDAGRAAEGLNAAEALAGMITSVRDLQRPSHPGLGLRDITCLDIASVPYPSVTDVPGEAQARFDCRVLPGEEPESLVLILSEAASRGLSDWPEQPVVKVGMAEAECTTWTGEHFAGPVFEPAWWTGEESPVVTGAQAALAAAGLEPSPTYYSLTTSGSYLAGVAGIPTIGFGVGDERAAHQIDEYVTLDSLRRGTRGFAALAAHLAG
jgi:acetylornithine deacetylase/succinyl-diaminopimelate desuccinylase-like protein